MRRIILVLAMLGLLAITALPAVAQGYGNDYWGNHGNNWGDNGNNWGDNGNNWWDNSRDYGRDNNRDYDRDDTSGGPGGYNNSSCDWYPSWWSGWQYWCWSPWYGWYQI